MASGWFSTSGIRATSLPRLTTRPTVGCLLTLVDAEAAVASGKAASVVMLRWTIRHDNIRRPRPTLSALAAAATCVSEVLAADGVKV